MSKGRRSRAVAAAVVSVTLPVLLRRLDRMDAVPRESSLQRLQSRFIEVNE